MSQSCRRNVAELAPKMPRRRKPGGRCYNNLFDDDVAQNMTALDRLAEALHLGVPGEAGGKVAEAAGILVRQAKTHHEMRQIGATHG
jgi:hypothetical protein